MTRCARPSRIAIVLAALLPCAGALAECVERGAIGYVCGVAGAEDMVAIPQTSWIVASGLSIGGQPGRLTLIDRANKTATVLLAAPAQGDRDVRTYRDCPGPVDAQAFSAHGVSLRRGANRIHTLYVVNHGGREAVEVFRLDASQPKPTLAWQGCVLLPPGSLGNGVTPLERDGIAVTLTSAPQYFEDASAAVRPEAWSAKFKAAQLTGHVVEWRPGHDWQVVPNTAGSGPNGIERSADGRWLWVANWASKTVVRVPRNRGDEPVVVSLDFMPDNLRWGDDGRLWVTGATGTPARYFDCWTQSGCKNDFAIAKIDPSSLTVTAVAHPRTVPEFGEATTVLKAGREVWIAAFPSDRIGYLRLDQ